MRIPVPTPTLGLMIQSAPEKVEDCNGLQMHPSKDRPAKIYQPADVQSKLWTPPLWQILATGCETNSLAERGKLLKRMQI